MCVLKLFAAPALGLLLWAGCGGGAAVELDGGGLVADATAVVIDDDARAVAPLTIDLRGGSAPSARGHGGRGGTIHFVTRGALSIDPALAPPAAPAPMAAPSGALKLTSAMLASDLAAAGDVSIGGTITSGGREPVREIAATGDIFVVGSLRGAQLAGARQGLRLRSAGTVHVAAQALIDAGGAPGSGQPGGPLTIVAARIVIAGQLVTTGADGPTGGGAGAITLTATADLSLSGRVAAAGGSGRGGATAGGHGGAVTLRAGGEIVVAGLVSLPGGEADGAQGDTVGGDGGTLTIDGDRALTFAGTVESRGGIATATTGGAAGGAGGSIVVGEVAGPARIDVLAPITLAGGEGRAAAGPGGTARLEPRAGDLRLAGLLDASGGDSEVAPGIGGTVLGNPGPDLTAGVDLDGHITVNGGSIVAGATGPGGDGGLIRLVVLSTGGDLTIAAGASVRADGGRSGGAGRAGAGGAVYLFTRDGRASMGGTVQARGGAAPDPGGTGGGGGFAYIFTDDNYGGIEGGVLIIETTGLIDVSGGTGTLGGSARNDGRRDSVALWPVNQADEYDVRQIAVLINCDGIHGTASGWIENLGRIVARGGGPDGWGGDVEYHGRRSNGDEAPASGDLDLAGFGAGSPGDYGAE